MERHVVPEVPVRVAGAVVVRVRDALLVVEVEVALEHRRQHPVEGEREHDRERPDDEPRARLPPDRVDGFHQVTWARLAKKSIRMVTTSSSGKR